YLVCHGVIANGRPFLWLESDDERTGRVAGDELVRRIADLPPEKRPLLIVLSSCQSAGAGHDQDALAALGPALARGGVAAVIAMQGNIPIATVERLMPAFFRALVEDGQIDRALAIARADLPGDHPWWMPVLFMQVRDGRAWSAIADEAPALRARQAGGSLGALTGLARDERVRTAVVAFSTDFQSACDQIDVLSSYKLLHDLFQQLEDAYSVMLQHARRLPGDETAWDDLEELDPDLQGLVAELLRVGGRARFASAEGLWMRRLERARGELGEALTQRDTNMIKRALGRIYEVLGRELSRMNSSLVTSARTLRLQQLLGALTTIRDQLALHQLGAAAQSQFEIFADGVTAMARLNARLGVLVATHDAFQEVDDELRRVKELLSQDVEELILAWGDIRQLAQHLYEVNPGEWGTRLSENSLLLDQAMAANEPGKIRRAFRTFHHQALLSFNKVDQDLLALCTELQQIGRPTEAVLKMLA
ncbi:MAG: CHAT domain-containing protein, partial [Chloroflexales bacterium]|nr:CHAT domain-containing protein [Chloroflexales bacterium]